MKRTGSKPKYVILANFDDWTISVITKDNPNSPVRMIHTIKFVNVYLRRGKGSFTKRLASVLKRLVTNSLKPAQA